MEELQKQTGIDVLKNANMQMSKFPLLGIKIVLFYVTNSCDSHSQFPSVLHLINVINFILIRRIVM